MVAKNDITGDLIKSKSSSKEYGDRYDAIFRKKTPAEIDQAKYEDEAFESLENFNKHRQGNADDTGK
jgi:hypothetical protein